MQDPVWIFLIFVIVLLVVILIFFLSRICKCLKVVFQKKTKNSSINKVQTLENEYPLQLSPIFPKPSELKFEDPVVNETNDSEKISKKDDFDNMENVSTPSSNKKEKDFSENSVEINMFCIDLTKSETQLKAASKSP